MKLLHNPVRRLHFVAWLVLCLLVGCLTSPNPFYQEKDIIQDSRFSGIFVSADDGLLVTISSDKRTDKRYVAQLAEGGKTSDYLATLFRIEDGTFVDLIPISEGKVFEQYKEGAPAASGLLQSISHDGKVRASTRLHVLLKVSLSDQKIECFGAKKVDDPSNPITKDSTIKSHSNGDAMVVTQTTESLQSVVRRYAGTNWEQLFQNNSLKLNRKESGR